MDEYQLDAICEKQTACNGRCMQCQLFAQYQNEQDGNYGDDSDFDYEHYNDEEE